jgi:hypothetical protein
MEPQSLQARLKDTSEGGPLDRLAVLGVEHALEQPLEALLPPAFLARSLVAGLEGWLASESAEQELATATARIRQALLKDPRSLREALPLELTQALTELARRRYSPDRRLVMAVLDRPPVRALVRGLLLNVLMDFSRRLSAPVTENKVARGLGGLVRQAAEQARSSAGAFGSLASAFSEELERQVERRARDFVDSALSGVLQQAADAICDPARAPEQAEMRVALVEGALGVQLAQVGQEMGRMDVPATVAAVRQGLSRWLASGGAAAELERGLVRLLEHDGKRPLREVLAPLGLLAPARELGREVLRARLAPLMASEPFARWLAELLQPPTGSP